MRFVFFLFTISTFFTAFAQDTTAILTIAEVMPKYPTGDSGLYQFIKQHIEYPQACVDSGIQGKVYVRFIVNAAGHVNNAEIIKGVNPAMNNEALRVANLLPDFIPGKNKGNNVSVYYMLPITFALTGTPTPKSTVFQVLSACDVDPQYPGGDNGLKDFLLSNTLLPKNKKGEFIQGENAVGFLIDTLGRVSAIRIVKASAPELDSEAVRVVKLFKPFTPATLTGNKVSCYVILNFNFSIYPTAPAPLHQLSNPPVVVGGDDAIFNQLERKLQLPPNISEYDTSFIINFQIDRNGIYKPQTSAASLSNQSWIARQSLALLADILKGALPAKINEVPVTAYYSLALKYTAVKGKIKFDRRQGFLKQAQDEMIYLAADKAPEFPGGDSALISFLAHVVIYPELERDNDIQGKVLLRFVINEAGRVGDIQVTGSVSPGLDSESVKAVSMLPNFIPGEYNGQRVSVYFDLPVIFRLE